MIFITLAHEDHKLFETTKEACLQLFGSNPRIWVIENGRLKVHCKFRDDVLRFSQWIEEMNQEVEATKMQDPEYVDLMEIINRLEEKEKFYGKK